MPRSRIGLRSYICIKIYIKILPWQNSTILFLFLNITSLNVCNRHCGVKTLNDALKPVTFSVCRKTFSVHFPKKKTATSQVTLCRSIRLNMLMFHCLFISAKRSFASQFHIVNNFHFGVYTYNTFCVKYCFVFVKSFPLQTVKLSLRLQSAKFILTKRLI